MTRKGWLLAGFLSGLLVLAALAPAAQAQQVFGAPPPPPQAAVAPEPTGPVELIAAPFPYPRPPATAVRVAILDSTTSLQRAGRIAVLLTQFRKHELEQHIGMKIELANISGIPDRPAMGNVVFYRPEFMRAAALLAKAIPGEQTVRVMPEERRSTSGVDVEIVLGEPTP